MANREAETVKSGNQRVQPCGKKGDGVHTHTNTHTIIICLYLIYEKLTLCFSFHVSASFLPSVINNTHLNQVLVFIFSLLLFCSRSGIQFWNDAKEFPDLTHPTFGFCDNDFVGWFLSYKGEGAQTGPGLFDCFSDYCLSLMLSPFSPGIRDTTFHYVVC